MQLKKKWNDTSTYCLYFVRKYMKYLAMSILAIRAIGCLVRGKNPCQRFASSWFRIFLEYSQQTFVLFCIIWQPRRSVAVFAEIFYLNGILNTIWPLWDLRDRPLWVFFNTIWPLWDLRDWPLWVFFNTIWPLWDLRDRPLWVFFNMGESFLI